MQTSHQKNLEIKRSQWKKKKKKQAGEIELDQEIMVIVTILEVKNALLCTL